MQTQGEKPRRMEKITIQREHWQIQPNSDGTDEQVNGSATQALTAATMEQVCRVNIVRVCDRLVRKRLKTAL